MCDPVSLAIASAVVTTVGTGASLIAQGNAAKKQEAAIRQQNALVAEENRIQTSTELFDMTRAARREQASIRTAAGEAGLSLTSGSIEGLLLDSAAQLELAQSRSIANMESRQKNINAETESMMSQIERPNALTVGLQLGGAALSGWSAVGDAKIKKSLASTPTPRTGA